MRNIRRRWIALALMSVLVIGTMGGCTSGCRSHKNEPATEPATEEMTTEEVTTEEPTTEPMTEEPTTEEPTTEDDLFRNPLTGEITEKDWSAKRPYFVMLNSIAQALPQRGCSKADLYIEMMEEGGITRVVGVYHTMDEVGKSELGSIRSTREYFYSWAMSFDGIMVHAGGDSWVLGKIKKRDYDSLNAIGNAYNYFYRDPERQKVMSNEHTMFTTGKKVKDAVKDLGLRTKLKTSRELTTFHFAEDGTPQNGTAAAEVKVKFSGYKSTKFIYDEETNRYQVYFWDAPYVDEGAKNTQVEVTNIIILPVPNWQAVDSYGVKRQKYDLSGGTGYYINGGKCIEIRWEKGDYNTSGQYGSPLHMYDAEGNELAIGIGKTYMCVINNTMPVDIQ